MLASNIFQVASTEVPERAIIWLDKRRYMRERERAQLAGPSAAQPASLRTLANPSLSPYPYLFPRLPPMRRRPRMRTRMRALGSPAIELPLARSFSYHRRVFPLLHVRALPGASSLLVFVWRTTATSCASPSSDVTPPSLPCTMPRPPRALDAPASPCQPTTSAATRRPSASPSC